MSPDFSQIQHRDYAIPASAINAKARTVELSFSSEEPYERWYGVEILDHRAEAVDLDRLNNGAALLVDHERTDQVGVIDRAWLGDDRKGRATVRFSRSARGNEIFQDVKDGIRKLVSVGYKVVEYVLESKQNDTETYRVTRWQPFEISIVSVPADATVGVGRSDSPTEEDVAMTGKTDPTKTANPAAGVAPAAPSAPAPDEANRGTDLHLVQDTLSAERKRIVEIRAIGEQHGLNEMANAAIDRGVTLDAFRAQVLDVLQERGTLRPAETPDIGMNEREVKNYSFLRALRAAADPANAHLIAPFETECSNAARDKRGELAKEREGGLTIPVDVLNRGIDLDGGAAASAARHLMARAAQRDLVAGTTTAGGHTVATELLGSSFIELLRNALVLDRMGITMLRDLNGNIAIPSQSGAATGYWVAENGAPTESQQTFGQVTLTPKTVGAFTDYSRRLLLQSSIDVEAFVRADLASVIAQTILTAAINGSGSSNQPEGLLNISGIGSVAGGTNGLAPTYDHMVDLETAIANANADVGSMAYLTNTKVRGKLRKTQEFASTNGKAVWTSGRERGIGDVLGYDAYTTNAVPSDLDKGTSTGVCSAIIMGVWSEFILGMWGGLDVMLDPYTGATAGTKRVVALQDLDFNVRHPAAFASMQDALTA